MHDALELIELRLDELARAIPLVEAISSPEEAARWRAESASRIASADGGILAIQTKDGFLRGVCRYRLAVAPAPATQRRLCIDWLGVGDSVYRRAAMLGFLERLDEFAKRLGCTEIQVDVAGDDDWLVGGAARAGYWIERLRLVRTVTGESPRQRAQA